MLTKISVGGVGARLLTGRAVAPCPSPSTEGRVGLGLVCMLTFYCFIAHIFKDSHRLLLNQFSLPDATKLDCILS